MMTKTYRQAAAMVAAVLVVMSTIVLRSATGTLAPSPYLTVLNANGAPISGACVWTYMAGTSTPVATYTDKTIAVANSNPIIADSSGQFVAYLVPGTSYKFVFETACTPPAHGSVLRTQDGIDAVPSAASALDVTGTAGETITGGMCAYLSDGSGAKVAGQWYKCDSGNGYSSIFPEVGLATSTITAATSGTFRLSGQATGLSGLTIGAEYYASTGGALTATAPSFRRHLGHADSTTTLIVTADPPIPLISFINDFRLSLTTATCVTTADVTAAGTLFWTPCTGNRVTVFSTTGAIETCAAAELSIAVPAAVSQVYDVWVFDSAFGACSMSLELLAWTNDTTRATAISRTNGRWTKTGDTSRLYLGSVRSTTVANQTEDSAAKRYLYNQYNRAPRSLIRTTTGNWPYTSGTIRQANATAANQVEIVVGVAEVLLDLRLMVVAAVANTGGAAFSSVGIGEDSTTTFSGLNNVANEDNAGDIHPLGAQLVKYPAVGRHFYSWNEAGDGVNISTFYGNSATSQSGLTGRIEQ